MCDAIIIRCGLTRSAQTPPTSRKTMRGTRFARRTRPRSDAEPVRSRTAKARATGHSASPSTLTHSAANRIRKSFPRSGPKRVTAEPWLPGGNSSSNGPHEQVVSTQAAGTYELDDRLQVGGERLALTREAGELPHALVGGPGACAEWMPAAEVDRLRSDDELDRNGAGTECDLVREAARGERGQCHPVLDPPGLR